MMNLRWEKLASFSLIPNQNLAFPSIINVGNKKHNISNTCNFDTNRNHRLPSYHTIMLQNYSIKSATVFYLIH